MCPICRHRLRIKRASDIGEARGQRQGGKWQHLTLLHRSIPISSDPIEVIGSILDAMSDARRSMGNFIRHWSAKDSGFRGIKMNGMFEFEIFEAASVSGRRRKVAGLEATGWHQSRHRHWILVHSHNLIWLPTNTREAFRRRLTGKKWFPGPYRVSCTRLHSNKTFDHNIAALAAYPFKLKTQTVRIGENHFRKSDGSRFMRGYRFEPGRELSDDLLLLNARIYSVLRYREMKFCFGGLTEREAR
jgi:hypothetical protein